MIARFLGARARVLGRIPLTVGIVATVAVVSALLALHHEPTGRAAAPSRPATVSHLPRPAVRLPVARPVTPRAAAAAPSSTTVVLRSGDTLSALAVRYRTTVAALQQLNHLGHSTLIYAGRALLVSGSAPQASVPARIPATAQVHSAAPVRAAAPVSGHGAAAAVSYALAQLGVPYRWGGAGNGGFDCSGLVMRAWQAGGVRLPHNAAAQADAGVRIARDQLRPGDLVVSNGFGHIQLYIGGGRVVEAPHTGAVVRVTALPPSAQVDAYIRVSA
jgi:cell wall-associated NlpC family hydrolase